jgi:cytochrome oxidase Cu insertion factor (SCO1/SenC/PrrC family)
LTRLQRELDFALGEDGGVRIILIATSTTDTPEAVRVFAASAPYADQPWEWLTGTAQAVGTIGAQLEPVLHPPDKADVPENDSKKTDTFDSVFIVDSNGGVRGRYPADSQGLAEVFHRSRHILFAKKDE